MHPREAVRGKLRVRLGNHHLGKWSTSDEARVKTFLSRESVRNACTVASRGYTLGIVRKTGVTHVALHPHPGRKELRAHRRPTEEGQRYGLLPSSDVS